MVVRYRTFTILSAASLVLCAVAASLYLVPDFVIVLREGGGGAAGGSSLATYACYWRRGQLGIGWTHSDVQFEGGVGSPALLLAAVAAILPTWWLVRARPA